MFTPWNEIRPKKYPSPGIPVVQLWQNPCNQSYPIPPGLTPWNQNSYLKHPSFECQFTQSRHNLCDRLNAIPLGTGKRIKKLKKAPPTRRVDGAFLFQLFDRI